MAVDKQEDVLVYLEDAYSFLMDPAIGIAIKEIKRVRQQLAEHKEALQCVTSYWDEWKDAPDDNEVALSLEEVVQICRETLGDK